MTRGLVVRCGSILSALVTLTSASVAAAGPAAAASDPPLKITDEIPGMPVEPDEVFFDQTFTFSTDDGQVVVASTADGTGQVHVDDEFELDVTHADGSTAIYIKNYEFQPPSPPVDVSGAFEPGANTVRVILRDTFGVSAGSTALYLVGTTSSERLTYVAMGDSYASGEGTPPFVEGTDTANNRCHRSVYAGAVLFADVPSAGVEMSLDHVACSGAKVRDLWGRQYNEPQSQMAALASLPDLVSVSIGGNDVGFSEILKDCLYRRPQACLRTGGQPGPVERQAYRRLDALTLPSVIYGGVSPLQFTYEQIQIESGGADLIVVGYPMLFPEPTETLCGSLLPGVQRWINDLISEGDRRIHETAISAGAEYASLAVSFNRHEACQGDGDPQWINGVVPRNTEYSFHPNVYGQGAIADALRVALAELGTHS